MTVYKKYKPEFCELVKTLMREGASLEECACEMGVTVRQMWTWRKDIPEFRRAVKHGLLLCKGWWLKKGRDNLGEHPKFDTSLWYCNMKNRFGWAEKKEVKHSGTVTHNHEQTDAIVRRCEDLLAARAARARAGASN